jgi:DNA-binding NarL/FixJ family response regulator
LIPAGAKDALDRLNDATIEWCNCFRKHTWHKKGSAQCQHPERKVLSEKHLAMLFSLAEGNTVKAAARKAGFSTGTGTAEYHMKVILYCLGAKNVAHAITIAFRKNIIW